LGAIRAVARAGKPHEISGPNETLFVGQTRVRQRTVIILFAGAHWRLLFNTIEPSVCGGDAVFGQIALTTCY